jgi:hypothetical protein
MLLVIIFTPFLYMREIRRYTANEADQPVFNFEKRKWIIFIASLALVDFCIYTLINFLYPSAPMLFVVLGTLVALFFFLQNCYRSTPQLKGHLISTFGKWIFFCVIILVTYVLFYALNEWHFDLSCC